MLRYLRLHDQLLPTYVGTRTRQTERERTGKMDVVGDSLRYLVSTFNDRNPVHTGERSS